MPNMRTNPLYPKDAQLLESQVSIIESTKKVTEGNKQHILKFLKKCQGAGISRLRLVFYANRLRQMAEIIGKTDFKKAKKEDIENLMANLEDRNYKPHTMDAFIVSLKCFYRWLYDLDRTESLPKQVRWIQRKRPPNHLKAENLLTDDEINLIVKAADDMMSKALICCLYEGALRPEELRGMKVGDVHINEHTVKIYVRGKMKAKEGDRVVYLARSYPLIKNWFQAHPEKYNPEAWMWPGEINNQPINASTMSKIISRLCKRANIKKKCWPYLFRHSMGTFLYKTFPTPIARSMMGHAENSRMERVYVHLAHEDLENSVKDHYNLKKGRVKVKPGVCVKCEGIIYFGTNCCPKCGLSQNTATAFEQDLQEQRVNKIMDMLMEDPVICSRIKEMNQEIKSKLGIEQEVKHGSENST